jgi:hypothetical protein
MIHRYFAQTDPDLHAKIIDLRETLISQLRVQARLDPLLAEPSRSLTEITERFIAGFDQLATRARRSRSSTRTRCCEPRGTWRACTRL